MAKLADAPDLGSGGEILRGSNPLPGTAKRQQTLNVQKHPKSTLKWLLSIGGISHALAGSTAKQRSTSHDFLLVHQQFM
jgi:hypothetical protein